MPTLATTPRRVRATDSNGSRPTWLRQRIIGDSHRTKIRTSLNMMQRLQLEATLEGHTGAVNCLEWNHKGNLLASGSEDHNVIVWNTFRATKKSIVNTGHQGSIFSVKFMPDNNQVATCASDGCVKLTDSQAGGNKNLLNCVDCHSDRVKRLATHPNQPNLLWSAGEDGLILQYDLRAPHVCCDTRPRNLLIDLKTISSQLVAKCMAVSPMRDEILAVGSNDIYCRLFDRRYLNYNTTYFVPGHLLNSNNRSNHLQSFGTTYLSFSPDGSELLASVHAEQVYLFNVHEPRERYKSFDVSLKPILLDKPTRANSNNNHMGAAYSCRGDGNSFSLDAFSVSSLPMEFQEEELSGSQKSPTEILHQLNGLISKLKTCPDLYRMRAGVLIDRGWRGDYYQALRDCCASLALKPLDYKTLNQLAIIVCRLGYRESANGLLEYIETIRSEFDRNNDDLNEAVVLLKSFKQEYDCYVDEPCDRLAAAADDELMFSNFNNNSTSNRQASTTIRQLFAGTQLSLAELDLLTNINGNQLDNDRKEMRRCSSAFDFSKRFCGHCNMNTDIKEASFFGLDGEFIVGGSDDGAYYVWDKATTNLVKAVQADCHILNCVQPHPSVCMLATSGIEPNVKLWSTQGKTNRDVELIESRCNQNQEYISIDPLEAMVMMLYPDRDIE